MASFLAPVGTTTLIFGGCCANVFALEQIVRTEPGSGLLITLLQFVLAALFAFATQFDVSAPYFVRQPKVPRWRWVFVAMLFSAINLLNNWAFAYNISVPVHIILRSFGSVTTMTAGFIRGKRYSPLQVLSVAILTLGVLFSAWADSEGKGKSMSMESEVSTSDFTKGLGILLVAQILSAYMGAYTEDTYAQFRASWTENLFYSHFYSLPLFLPFSGAVYAQYKRLLATKPFVVPEAVRQGSLLQNVAKDTSAGLLPILLSAIDTGFAAVNGLPEGLVFLSLNALTQLACISGVNLLSAQSSAVTVTIVLNIRKLVSFILSTLIFGHTLTPKMVLGSVLVFGSGAMYSYETSWRIPQQRRRAQSAAANKAPATESKKEL